MVESREKKKKKGEEDVESKVIKWQKANLKGTKWQKGEEEFFIF